MEGAEEEEIGQISKKKQKKLERNPRKAFSKSRENTQLCCEESCHNPFSLKCSHGRCRRCCKEVTFNENLDCEGHRVFIKSNREKAKLYPKEKLAEEVAAGVGISDVEDILKINKAEDIIEYIEYIIFSDLVIFSFTSC